MAPLMHSPSRGVFTIMSRYWRCISGVSAMPSGANRLLQVAVLSSMASRPRSPATSARAVSMSGCGFIGASFPLVPCPVADLRHVLPVQLDVAPVLHQLGRERALERVSRLAGLRQAVERRHHEVEAVEVVEHGHVERGRDRAFFLVAAHVDVV